jgi:hypothetical protein
MTTESPEAYGPLVRLWGVDASQLPGARATAEELKTLLESLLTEGASFISDVPSRQQSPHTSTWRTRGSRTFASSSAPVHLYERTVPAGALRSLARGNGRGSGGDIKPETWYLRRSVHKDASEPGTATWEEWVRCFKTAHAETEKEFTPTVVSTQKRQEWDCAGIEVTAPASTGAPEGTIWEDWTLRLEESVHRMPVPLKPRVFPVLQATAAARGRREFVVVQVAAGASWAAAGEEHRQHEDHVLAAYTSVERVRETAEGVEWIMGTVSDARGALPPWVQRMAMPGPIAKDVDLFLGWIKHQRGGETALGSAQNGK